MRGVGCVGPDRLDSSALVLYNMSVCVCELEHFSHEGKNCVKIHRAVTLSGLCVYGFGSLGIFLRLERDLPP